MPTQLTLKTTFNKHAEQYHQFRPHYPAQLFTKLIQTTAVTSQSNLLEIGPGTGQATEPLAQIGCFVTGIELGTHLAAKARRVLRAFPNVRIITGSFEESELPAASFDLVYSATAFHWIKPEYKFNKTAELLKPDGHLAIIHTEHVSDEKGDRFFRTSHPLYQKYGLNSTTQSSITALPTIDSLKPPAIDQSLFEFVSFDTFPIAMTYSAKEYTGLLDTYSPIIAMPSSKRESFLREIEQLITREFDGSAVRNFAFTLTIAKKK